MAKRHSPITYLYDRIILQRPGIVILCVLAVVSFLGYKAKDFKLDASAETLILERDEDLRYSRLIESRYGQDDYLIIAFTPKNDLFSDETLEKLARLRNDLMQLQNVSSIVSILDAPLLQGPSLPLKALAANSLTLESPTTDRRLARTEFASSPLYQNLLVSPDLKTTALQIKFRTDPTYEALLARRYLLREKQIFEGLSPTERAEFKKVTEAVEKERDEKKKVRHRDIAAIREIMKKYRPDGELFLGGISMVADDLISFIKNDLKTFGLGVTFFLVITLSLIFRKKRWVLLPMLCCAASSISMMGLLGLFGWQVTVISSNFISLQLIITMAITIHLIVRYRELLFNDPGAEQRQLVLNTVRSMVTPCL
jgi:predicted RND superfamily exporter protein